jgi:predicted nucleotide-binding protein (sugar kinase/HSP70/actin superfamily)
MATSSNPCTRCGKDRIITKVWKEEIEITGGTTTVTHTEMSCPDDACQAKVEHSIAVIKEKRAALAKAKEESELRRRTQQHPAIEKGEEVANEQD